MTISIVMTTYRPDKERLLVQLDSLRSQTLPASEVLIFDDNSGNDTLQLLRDYIRQWQLVHWSVISNEKNLGWKRNFAAGLNLAAGDYVFPCDQDDEWYPEKLEKMCRAMEENPSIDLLACDTDIFYETGAIKAKHYYVTDEAMLVQYPFRKNFFQNPRPGCSYAIRGAFLRQVMPGWQEGFPYDEWLWLMATLRGTVWFYNEKLIHYRRYAGNASDIRYKDIPMQLENLDYISRCLTSMQETGRKLIPAIPEERFSMVQIACSWCEKRKQLLRTRNPIRWLLLAPWWGYYNSPKNCLSDLWLVLFGSFRRKK